MVKNKDIILKAITRGYIVTRQGRLYNFKTKKYRKLNNAIRGRLYIRLRIKKENKNLYINRLMGYQKFGNEIFKKGIEVRHLNGNYKDNSYRNIAIGTLSQNRLDIPKQTRVRLASIANRKFTNNEIKNIINDRKKGLNYSALSDKYNVARCFFSYLFNKALYKYHLNSQKWDKTH